MSGKDYGRPAAALDRVSEDARVRDCERCRRRVLRGLCDGFDTSLELMYLTPLQEAVCIAIGWDTYEAQIKSGYAWLVQRSLLRRDASARYARTPPVVMPKHFCPMRGQQ